MEAGVTLRGLLRAVGKHWLVAGSVFIATLLVVGIVFFNAVPIYESTAVLLVKFGREFVHTPGVGDRSLLSNPRDREAIINAEVQILLSHDLIESVLSSLDQRKLYPDLVGSASEAPVRSEAVERFRRSFSVEAIAGASVIRISFRHRDPETTARVVNQIVDHFKEKHLQAFGEPETTVFLQQKVATYRDKLDESEEEIQRFQAENRPFLDRGELILRQREDLAASLRAVGSEIAGLRERLAYLTRERENSLKQPSTAAKSDPAVNEAKARLLELQLEEQKLLAGFREDSRQVLSIRKQIELVKNFLEEEEAATPKGGQSGLSGQLETQVIDTRAQLLSQEAKKNRLEQQFAALNVELATLPRLDAKYRDLMRGRDENEKNYQTYTRNLEEARISEEMDRHKIANISVIQEGIVPTEPIWPRKKQLFGIGLLVGAALGVGLALVLEATSPEERRRVVVRTPRPGEATASRAERPRGLL